MMAANSVDSDQYVDGSIDSDHLADDAVTGAKLANNIDIAGTLDVTGVTTLDNNLTVAGSFVSPRLPTEAVSNATTLSAGTHAGKYNICAGNVTLPSTSTAGEHYTLLNTTGGNITVGRNSRNINGASSDLTVATYNAVTCIAIGSNNWIALGV